jgi:hypothetical protein
MVTDNSRGLSEVSVCTLKCSVATRLQLSMLKCLLSVGVCVCKDSSHFLNRDSQTSPPPPDFTNVTMTLYST